MRDIYITLLQLIFGTSHLICLIHVRQFSCMRLFNVSFDYMHDTFLVRKEKKNLPFSRV
jgi:hypothetical protein